jgi:hypothetical protein
MFPEKHRNYGVCEACSQGVKVWWTSTNYDYIYMPNTINAYWTGGCNAIIVERSDGKKLRFKDFVSYDFIY